MAQGNMNKRIKEPDRPNKPLNMNDYNAKFVAH